MAAEDLFLAFVKANLQESPGIVNRRDGSVTGVKEGADGCPIPLLLEGEGEPFPISSPDPQDISLPLKRI